EIYMDELVGGKIFEAHGEEFPLLIKFIDSNDWLSIQVHPSDELAARRNIGSGKTEMWYVLQADKGAQLISGFSKKTDKDNFMKHLQEKTLDEILNTELVSSGDVFYMPAGRIHSLGPGILLAEIQQTSDITYRIHDFDRVDASGNARELHTELALDALDFTTYPQYRSSYKSLLNQTNTLVHCSYFASNLLRLNKPLTKNYNELDSFVVYLGTAGNANIHYSNGVVSIRAGECVLLPAVLDQITIIPDSEVQLLEIYVL
ncbi:MAG: mannose-6-phosphate isomerase, partial [bacterium]|nr:mannose-6-phosphate isomerase [bacterium]